MQHRMLGQREWGRRQQATGRSRARAVSRRLPNSQPLTQAAVVAHTLAGQYTPGVVVGPAVMWIGGTEWTLVNDFMV